MFRILDLRGSRGLFVDAIQFVVLFFALGDHGLSRVIEVFLECTECPRRVDAFLFLRLCGVQTRVDDLLGLK